MSNHGRFRQRADSPVGTGAFALAACIACLACGQAPADPESQPVSANPEWVFIAQDYAPRTGPDDAAPKSGVALKACKRICPESAANDREGALWLGWDSDGERLWAPESLFVPAPSKGLPPGNLPIGGEIVDRWRGIPFDYRPDDLEPLPEEFRADPTLFSLRSVAREAAIRMFQAAKAEGVTLRAVSAWRSAERQRELYLRRVKLSGAGQNTVAKPGHSEHQLGTALDVNGPDEKVMLEEAFGKTKEGAWIRDNAGRFGFIVSYTRENQPLTGYAPEPWHIRYVGVERIGIWKPLGPPPDWPGVKNEAPSRGAIPAPASRNVEAK